MLEKIKYVKKLMGNNNNISIHTGKLTKKETTELGKHFKLKKEPLGYTNFYIL